MRQLQKHKKILLIKALFIMGAFSSGLLVPLELSTSFAQSVTSSSYDPFGPDRDCSDFATHREAYEFFVAAGGPAQDPHGLDRDNDGIPCEALLD